MKTLATLGLLFILFSGLALGKERQDSAVYYKKQTRSLVPWTELNEAAWLDIREWKKDLAIKESIPDWEQKSREAKLVETVGRFLDCVGTCEIYHSENPMKAQFRSEIMEADEVTTSENSYAWIFLMDGTMVRLSPESSVSFKEIAVGEKEVLIHARINYGNVLWIAREATPFKENNLSETEVLFLPLVYSEANAFLFEKKSGDLLAQIDDEGPTLTQYKKLNETLAENKKKMEKGMKRESYAFLVMPNGTVYGNNLTAEFVVLLGGNSYFKKRSFSKMYNPELEGEASKAQFFFRGFDKADSFDIETERWYKVNSEGSEIAPYENDAENLNFYIGENLTSRIPTLFYARELLWKDYSDFIFTKMTPQKLGEKYNYRLWGSLSDAKSDLTLRVEFLKEHTRRVETTQLRVSEAYRKKVEGRGEKIFQMSYDDRFYKKAVEAVLFGNKVKSEYRSDQDLNSTKKRFWELVNGRR